MAPFLLDILCRIFIRRKVRILIGMVTTAGINCIEFEAKSILSKQNAAYELENRYEKQNCFINLVLM